LPDAEPLDLVLYPRADGDLAAFLRRVTMTHTQRYHAKSQTVGYGHIYQGRYKSLLVESDRHFLGLVRYVERNARRAGLVAKAEDWPWSSVHVRRYGHAQEKKLLSAWPVAEPPDYLKWLNHAQRKEEIEKIRQAIKRSRPYGSEKWVSKTVRQFGLESTTRNRGRPKKAPDPFLTSKRSRPYGSEKWVSQAVRQFGLESTARNRGRPNKGSCPLSSS
jgi:putative transposase